MHVFKSSQDIKAKVNNLRRQANRTAIYMASSKIVVKIMRKGGELKTYLKVIALILFVVPLLVMSTPTAYAFPQNNHHYKFTGITYDPVSFKKIGDAKSI